MTSHDYDLFVIGAGSGGVRAARIAAAHGARVAIAEEFRFGGTCVIRGCVPKKLLVYASRFADEFEDAAGFGWTVGATAFSWPALVAAKNAEIARLEGLYRNTLAKAGATVIADRASLIDRHTVALTAAGTTVTAKTILIATGGAPYLGDPIPGLEHVITSNEALELPELPRRIVIYGGGYIAVEFASIFAGLGTEVTIVYRGAELLRGFDHDLRADASAAYQARGIRVVTGQRIVGIAPAGDAFSAELDGGERLAADRIMFAIGRSPNTSGLGLEAAGVALGRRGEVIVDASSQSSVANIYAVGDVTDRVNLTPAAIREGHAFADSVFGSKPWTASSPPVATAVFSTPEIGTVGDPEHEAQEKFGVLDIYKTRFRPMRATLSGRAERMLMKLVVDRASQKVVGCHVLGADAAEIVQMAAIAIRMGATKADFDATVALHPTAAEELVTLREAWTPPEMTAKTKDVTAAHDVTTKANT